MYVSSLLSDLKITCFSDLLKYFCKLDQEFNVLVDGGAGLGETSEMILKVTNERAKIFAFEPNPNNIREFKIQSPQLTLVDSALGVKVGQANFNVTANSVTDKKNINNQFIVSGTSFVGKLESAETALDIRGSDTYSVDVVRLDGVMKQNNINKIDFIKLDLQGGELDALKGLGELLSTVKFMWIEYSGQQGVLDILEQNDFVVFDTRYLFVGEFTSLIGECFELEKSGKNSIGKSIFFGTRKHVWPDYDLILDFCRRNRRLIQTDIVAVNKRHLTMFLEVVSLIIHQSADDKLLLPDLLQGIINTSNKGRTL